MSKTKRVSLQSFKDSLRYNWGAVHKAIAPEFPRVLSSIPLLERYAPSLRRKFETDPDYGVVCLLEILRTSEDVTMWSEFFYALDKVQATSTRRFFITDENLKCKLTYIHTSFLN